MKRLQSIRSNLTLFTTCKPWNDSVIAADQYNALKSWTMLIPRPEIIVYGNEFGSGWVAAQLGLIHRPDVRRHRNGLPFVNSLFENAQADATSSVLCYVNADIVMVRGLTETARIVEDWARTRKFMVVGQRFDAPALGGKTINMNPGWQIKFEQFARASGELHNPAALDWFMFRRGSVTDVPEFVMACTAYDNWLLLSAARKKFRTIDATDAVFAVHQTDSPVIPNAIWDINRRLWRQENPQKGEGSIAGCNWVLSLAINDIAITRRIKNGPHA